MSEEKLNEEIEDIETAELVEEVSNDSNTNHEEINKLKDSYQRLQADFANYKRRQEAERASIYKYASESVITKLLTVVDNFERALKDANEEDVFVKGVKMIKTDLDSILQSEGVEVIASDNEKFDPNLHHAVFMEENPEYEADHIIETFQKGYKLKDKVIRPAMVKVSS